MRTLTATLAASIAMAMQWQCAAQPAGCFTRSDLAIFKTVARDFEIIDTAHKGCVTSAEIERYQAAAKADRVARAARIAATMRTVQ